MSRAAACRLQRGKASCAEGVLVQGLGLGPCEVATGGEDGAVRVWDTRQRDAPVAGFAPEGEDKVATAAAPALDAHSSLGLPYQPMPVDDDGIAFIFKLKLKLSYSNFKLKFS